MLSLLILSLLFTIVMNAVQQKRSPQKDRLNTNELAYSVITTWCVGESYVMMIEFINDYNSLNPT